MMKQHRKLTKEKHKTNRMQKDELQQQQQRTMKDIKNISLLLNIKMAFVQLRCYSVRASLNTLKRNINKSKKK